jgi:hypothetical protein
MIRYSLNCKKGHSFEGWFASGDAFASQQTKKQVICPTCGSTAVEKALMAPNVVTSKKKARKPTEVVQSAPEQQQRQPVEGMQLTISPEQREILAKMRKLRDEVLSKSEYVGPRFAEEARRLHTEDATPKGIYGEATPSEVEALVDEGIEVFPIPVLPDDQN